jgi:hypothetical protein
MPLSEPKGVRGEVGGRVGGSFWTPGGTNSSKFRSLRKAPQVLSGISPDQSSGTPLVSRRTWEG